MAERPRGPIAYDLDWRSVVVFMAAFIGLVTLIGLLRAAPRSLTWITIGTLLALALNPVIEAVSVRLGGRRVAAIGLVLLVLVFFVSLLVALLGPRAAEEARALPDDLPIVLERLEELPIIGDDLIRAEVPQRIETFFDELPERLATDGQPIETVVRGVLGGVLAAFSTLLVTIALLIDGRRITAGASRLVPAGRRDDASRLADVLYRVIGRYFAGSLFVAALAGTTMMVVGLVLGVPLAPLIGVWVTFTNLIPQIGGAAGGVPFVALGFTESPTTGVICLVVFLIYQQIENNVLQPVVIGQAVDLSPPVTMVAALVGVSAAGVPGALVAVPLLGAAKAFVTEVRHGGPSSAASEASAEIRPEDESTAPVA